MWYVVQTVVGRERATAKLITNTVPQDVLQECFNPEFETEIKVRGAWVLVHKSMLPGYLIAVAADPRALDGALRSLTCFARVVKQGGEYVPLTNDEAALIDTFTEPGNRVVPMSRGFKDGDAVVIQKGPLVGHQARIVKVDRHKSMAMIEFDLCGRSVTARLGLCVMSKMHGAAA